jgi:hypothetical protein
MIGGHQSRLPAATRDTKGLNYFQEEASRADQRGAVASDLCKQDCLTNSAVRAFDPTRMPVFLRRQLDPVLIASTFLRPCRQDAFWRAAYNSGQAFPPRVRSLAYLAFLIQF